jgi:hypothetical protein
MAERTNACPDFIEGVNPFGGNRHYRLGEFLEEQSPH